MSREAVKIVKFSQDTTQSIRTILVKRGWVIWTDDMPVDCWNLRWQTRRYDKADHAALERFQYLNHFPRSSCFTAKDTLAKSMQTMAKQYPEVYDFHPLTFTCPKETEAFKAFYDRLEAQARKENKEAEKNDRNLWICKPAASRRGQNIYVISHPDQIESVGAHVVQQYVASPYLVGGYKFDLRIYVFVTSFRPLKVFIYDRGLARFSTEKYDTNDITNVYRHLTNVSINKKGPSMSTVKEGVGVGCKWTLAKMFEHLKSENVDVDRLWQRIIDIAILTVLPAVNEIPSSPQCFELFGFDVLLDDQMRPWLLEVNASPAIATSGPEDLEVKVPLLNDLFDLVGLDSKRKGSVSSFVSSSSEVSSESKADVISPVPLSIRKSLSNVSRHSRRSSLSKAQLTGFDPEAVMTHQECGGFRAIFPFDRETDRLSRDLLIEEKKGTVAHYYPKFAGKVIERLQARRNTDTVSSQSS